MEITAQQAIEVLLKNGMNLTIESGNSEFWLTLVSTMIGAIFGGMITLIVNRRFEIDRLRINNIIEMHRLITPEIQKCQKALGIANRFLNDIKQHESMYKQEQVLDELRASFFDFNQQMNNYEIELSMFLDEYEHTVALFITFISSFAGNDMKKTDDVDILIECVEVLCDKLATLSEDISEYKRQTLCGKKYRYWSKPLENGKMPKMNIENEE